MSVEQWTYLIVGLSFALYLYIGYRSRVCDTRGVLCGGAWGAAGGERCGDRSRLDECRQLHLDGGADCHAGL
jgi:hypothetical protein